MKMESKNTVWNCGIETERYNRNFSAMNLNSKPTFN